MANKKLQVWLPLLFSIVMIIGMFIVTVERVSQGLKEPHTFLSRMRLGRDAPIVIASLGKPDALILRRRALLDGSDPHVGDPPLHAFLEPRQIGGALHGLRRRDDTRDDGVRAANALDELIV